MPFFRGMPTGPEVLGNAGHISLVPGPPCATLTRLVGHATNTCRFVSVNHKSPHSTIKVDMANPSYIIICLGGGIQT